jgi:hypothetical protein
LRKRDFQKEAEDQIKDNRSSNGNAEDGPPAEPFNHPHPDDEKNESCGNKTEKINHQGIKDQDRNTQQRPEPGAPWPEGGRRGILLPVFKDENKRKKDQGNRKPEREKARSWMPPFTHGEMGGTPGRNDPDDQKNIPCDTIPLINREPSLINRTTRNN